MPGRPFQRTILLLLLLAASGCSELHRHRECRRLADTVNPLLADIETRGKTDQPSAGDYSDLAERYRELKGIIRKFDIQDKRLDDAMDAYLEMVTLAEKQLRQAANAMNASKGKDKGELDAVDLLRRHQAAMSPVLAQQGTVQGRLRGLCQP